MPLIIALSAGILFGAGLTISDMINPARVLNFLDVAGRWDPSLIFVMIGALAVTAVGYRVAQSRPAPLYAKTFAEPAAREIDSCLIAGAIIFGIGWGLAGICPGPAVTALVSLEPKMLVFVAAMLAGMLGTSALRGRFST